MMMIRQQEKKEESEERKSKAKKKKTQERGKNHYFSPSFPNKNVTYSPKRKVFWISSYCNYWQKRHAYLLEPQHHQSELFLSFRWRFSLFSLWHESVSAVHTGWSHPWLDQGASNLASGECPSHSVSWGTERKGRWSGGPSWKGGSGWPSHSRRAFLFSVSDPPPCPAPKWWAACPENNVWGCSPQGHLRPVPCRPPLPHRAARQFSRESGMGICPSCAMQGAELRDLHEIAHLNDMCV